MPKHRNKASSSSGTSGGQAGTGEGGGVDPSLMKLMLLKRIAELESEDPVQGVQVEIEAELHKAEEALPQLDEDEACHRLDEVLNDLGRSEEERLTSAKELCAAQAEAVERLEKSKKLLLEGCRCVGEKAKRLPKQLEEANKRKGNRENLKATLGEICRKLQQKNKSLELQQKLLAKESMKKRHELRANFEEMLKDIRSQMGEEDEEKKKEEENEDLRSKLKMLTEHMEAQRPRHEQLREQKRLEEELASERVKHQKRLLESEKLVNEALAKKRAQEEETLEGLRQQVSLYKERFQQFDGSLKQSSDILTQFQARIDEIVLENQQAEQENQRLKASAEELESEVARAKEQLNNIYREVEEVLARKVRLEKECRLAQCVRIEKTAKIKALQDKISRLATTPSLPTTSLSPLPAADGDKLT